MLGLQATLPALLRVMRDYCQEGILGEDTRQKWQRAVAGAINLMASELSTAVLHMHAMLAPPWQLAPRKTQLKKDPSLVVCLTSSSGRFCCFQHWGNVGY